MSDNTKLKGILFLFGGLLSLVAAGGLVLFFAGRWGGDEPKHVAGPALHLSRDESLQSPAPDLAEGDKHKEEHWVLYITGAVRRPGVYKLPPGSRVYELVEQAGGLTDSAVPEAFNMAAPLADGIHIHVPDESETVSLPSFDNSKQTPAVSGAAAFGVPDNEENLIDINTADATVLERLPGIGPKTAEAIIRYREQEGPFKCVEDLLSVRGIGPVKLEGLRDQVRVGR
jgi:competence protein ComEA